MENVQKSYTPVSTTFPIKNQIKLKPRHFVERHLPSDNLDNKVSVPVPESRKKQC